MGGAALVAWLALSLPFALAAIARARHPLARGLALGVLVLGFYAAFTTFSRIVYGAMLIAAAILGGLALLRPAAGPTSSPRPRPGALLLLVGGLVSGCMLLFQWWYWHNLKRHPAEMLRLLRQARDEGPLGH